MPKPTSCGELPEPFARLRNDLVFTPRGRGTDMHFVVEDPVHSKFFRMGVREYEFIQRWVKHGSVDKAVSSMAAEPGAFSLAEAQQVVAWLHQMNLVDQPSVRPDRSRPGIKWFNPLFIRIPLFCPDRAFTSCYRFLAPLTGKTAAFIWLCVCGAAVWQVSSEWSHVVERTRSVLVPGNWLLLALAWLLLKLIHELAHGLFCKKLGGTVRECGVVLAFLTPLAYVDVSSSWRFPSKWARITTSLAGMYAELFVASLAALLWVATDVGVVNHFCFNLMLMASVSTLLFNANPLMKFDGYYALADALEVHNLYDRGRRSLGRFATSLLFGSRSVSNHPGEPRWIGVYGMAALIWRVTVCVSLVIMATALFEGLGIVLAMLAVAYWVRNGWLGGRRLLLGKRLHSPAVAARAIVVSGLLGALLCSLWCWLPYPARITAPGVVRHQSASIVRADSDGFVADVRVVDGQVVAAGELIATLRNDELQASFAQADIAVEKSQLRCRQLRQAQKLAELQREQENLRTLQEKREQLAERIARLRIIAPVSGVVNASQIDSLLGRFVQEGDEMVTVGAANNKELLLAIEENDLGRFESQIGNNLGVRLLSGRVLQCRLTSIDPAATLTPPHPALSSESGGPLLVQQRGDAIELTAPRFRATAVVSPDAAELIRVGSTGVVTLAGNRLTVGRFAVDSITRWVRSIIDRK